MSTMLEVEDLSVSFPTRTGMIEAVRGISFSLGRERLGIVGESGSGKTTVGRLVLGLLEPTSGQILFDGEDVTHCARERSLSLRRQVQVVFQDPYSSLNPRQRVADIIREPLDIHEVETPAARRKRVGELMERVRLPAQLARHYPHELSGGLRQRVSIATALALGPKLIVADEPVSMVDASLRMAIVNLFRTLRDDLGVSIIYITHDLATAYYISDRIIIMQKGKVVESGDARVVLDNPTHPYSILLKSSVLSPDAALGGSLTG